MNADEVKTSVDKMETTNEETNNHNIMNADETKTSVDETKPLVDETETTNDEAKSTAIIESKDLVVRISNVKYPTKAIKLVTAEKYIFEAIKNAVRQQFLQEGSMVKPVLKNITYDSVTGCVLVECADEETRDWFHKVLPNIGKSRGHIPPLKVVIGTPYPVYPQPTSLVVAISRPRYPKEYLKSTQATQVLNNLKKKALIKFHQKKSKIKPVLQNTTFDSVTGCVMVECADQETLGWLHKFVPKMGLSKGVVHVKVISNPVEVKQRGRKGTASSEAATDILDDNVPKASTDDVHSDNVPQDPTDNIYDDNVPQGSEDESEMDESEDFKDEPTFIGSLNQNGTYSGNPNSGGNSNANRNRIGSNSFGGSNSNGGSGNSCNEGNAFTRATFEERFDNSNRSNSGNSFDGSNSIDSSNSNGGSNFIGGSSNSYNEGFGGNYSSGEGRNWNTSGNSTRNWNRSGNYGIMVGSNGNSYNDRRNYSSEGDKNNASTGRNWNTSGNSNRNWNQSGNSSRGSTRFDDANSFGDGFGRSKRDYPGDSYNGSGNSYNEGDLFNRGNYATGGGRNNSLDGGNWSKRRTTLEADASTGSRGISCVDMTLPFYKICRN